MKLLLLFVVGLASQAMAQDGVCGAEEQDDRVYSFGYGPDFSPYMAVDDEGNVFGFSYNLVRAVCKVMNKKCVHTVMYDYGYCWDSSKNSLGLHQRWWDACVSWRKNPDRISSVGFVMDFTKTPESYLFVRAGSNINSVNDIRTGSSTIGLIYGFSENKKCLQKFLGMSLNDRTDDTYTSYPIAAEALDRNEFDVLFTSQIPVEDYGRFMRLSTSQPIRCSLSGYMLMTRKDTALDLQWMETGLDKLKKNGDYQWYCNMANQNGDVECL